MNPMLRARSVFVLFLVLCCASLGMMGCSDDAVHDNTPSATTPPDASDVVSLRMSPTSISMAPQDEVTVEAEATYGDKTTEDVTQKVVWTSSDGEVATIQNGVVTAVAPGETTIRAQLEDLVATATVTVVAADVVLTKIRITTASDDTDDSGPIDVGKDGVQLLATAVYSDGSTHDSTDSVTWTSDDPTIATVLAGKVAAVALGTVQIEAKQDGIVGTIDVQITSIHIDTIFAQGQSYTLDTDTGILAGETSPLAGWDEQAHILHTSWFTVEDGAELQLTGSSPFVVEAAKDITVDGRIDFTGLPGAYGAGGANGEDGGRGGDITLQANNRITITGLVIADGGAGGDGSRTTVNDVDGTVYGNDGGAGGNGGTITFDTAHFVSTDEAIVSVNGGNGGDAGNVVIDGEVEPPNRCIAGYGGNGGNGGEITFVDRDGEGSKSADGSFRANGGNGGDGGDCSAFAGSEPQIMGGSGGSGGTSIHGVDGAAGADGYASTSSP